MRTIIFLFVATVGLMLILKYVVTPRYGDDVRARFLERSDYIPSKSTLLTVETLGAWLADPSKKDVRAGYVVPVLFPLDIIFLLILGALLGFASVSFAEQIPFLSRVPVWIWWVLPALYMIADVAEDSFIAVVLKGMVELTNDSYLLLSKLKALKLVTVGLAIGQAALLGGLILLMRFLPAPR